MSCPCEAAEAGASSLATPKRMLLGVLALLLISAVVVGVVLKLQSPQVYIPGLNWWLSPQLSQVGQAPCETLSTRIIVVFGNMTLWSATLQP